MPLTGGQPYPADAVAECRARLYRSKPPHPAPQPDCTCGFHALSVLPDEFLFSREVVRLAVALSGRVLAFEWPGKGVLWRAARQTVVQVNVVDPGAYALPWSGSRRRRPEDPEGRLAARLRQNPQGTGPIRIQLPQSRPPVVRLRDDAGLCVLEDRQPMATSEPVLTPV
jgi:hypothetical protein